MRLLVSMVAMTVVSAAIVVGIARAKGSSVAVVCGASSCATTHGERAVWPLYGWWNRPFVERRAPAPAPYYRIRLTGGGATSVALYAPSRHAIRIWRRWQVPPQGEIGPYWRTVPRDAAATMRPFLEGIRPFAAARGWRH